MSCCLRQTFTFQKKYLMYNKHSLKHFSALSSINDRFNKKVNLTKVTRSNNFFLPNTRTFYESLSLTSTTKFLQEILVEAHDYTGFSWTTIIVATSAVMKLFINIPCGIHQQYLVSKLELTKIELGGMVKSLKEKVLAEAVKNKWSKTKIQSEFMAEIRKQKKILIEKNNCHPFKYTILIFLQWAFWLLFTMTIKALALDASTGQPDYVIAALQFQVGGPFWCPNLSLPDSTFLLPVFNFLILLITTEISILSRNNETKNKVIFFINKIFPSFLRLLAVLFFYISAASPSGLSLFWASSSLFTLAQNLLLMSPKVRRFLKIPKTPSELDKPYSQLWSKFLQRFKASISKSN